jgi:bifunctional DNA-binding transcriptional regulator/antitoxin component of YhaV-PrlF toxin-antitoxin module
MTKTVHGIVHGKTIELREDLGVAEGQEVEITVRTVAVASVRNPGDGFLRTEGALANDPEWDGIMQEIYEARKQERRPPVSELDER